MLDGGRDGDFFAELEDYFYYAQIKRCVPLLMQPPSLILRHQWLLYSSDTNLAVYVPSCHSLLAILCHVVHCNLTYVIWCVLSLLSQGPSTVETRRVSVTIPLDEVPGVMRAIGYYPTEQEVCVLRTRVVC